MDNSNLVDFGKIFDPDFEEKFVRQHLLQSLNQAEEYHDMALVNSLHVVIAYYSVPGEYMEGAYDGPI